MRLFIYLTIVLVSLFDIQAQNYQVLYTEQINNNDNIVLMNLDGKSHHLTSHNRKDSSPMMSPDGKYLVFTSERVGWWKIWKMNIAEKTFTQLTNSSNAEYNPSWSPDGKSIVFVSTRTGKQEIFVMSSVGGNIKRISGSGASNVMPYWGQDNYIYYSSKIDSYYQIVKCLPDGTKREVLTSGNSNKLMPRVSRDASKILYYGDEHGNVEIYRLDIPEMTSKRLTNHPLMDMRANWSPDGQWIVFERGNKSDNHHVYIMDANGDNQRQLTFKNYNYSPSFSTIKLKD
ncbi:DUF5050 domain-containing protein [Winogradskyella sp. 3972H.M.0a.05]|uniref:TolB family protein n=1 Tax=Winogradskyella sp. 3972H.M.0a.05 TaxID=2950277 RepID=UPI003399A1F0